ncbi:hypothetical protein M422DRAFT_43184 [Sphaerobolus stellatus SS14]|nr:hypothetical protein M422DRAFT_43184 [Sphaerobolus stellatus SS14]
MAVSSSPTVFNWNTFVGGNQICFKACFNSITSPDYYENRYDSPVGCEHNMPSAMQNGTFTEYDGDLQDVVALTWSMSDPLTTSPPYIPRIPASSSCKTFQAADLFLAAPTSSVGSSPSLASQQSISRSLSITQSNSASMTGTDSKATGTSGSGSSVSAGSGVGASGASPTGTTSGGMSLHASIGVLGVVAGVVAVLL